MGKKVYILFILLILISCMFLFAQRGLKVVVKTSEGPSLTLYEQYRALVIGVSDYLYWPKLPNAVKDARDVAAILGERGFMTRVLENPDSEEIKGALDRLVFRESGAGDGVLIFFAGHGETMKLADSTELGYIIPKDCPLKSEDPIGFSRKAISMEDIQTYSLQLKSKHLLAIFDSCFSGSIFALGRAAPADITFKTAQPVRQYITAGGGDETVPDESIFKRCFLDALKGEADANNDGYVTGSEMGMYLESKVVNYSRNAQHPQYGKIRNPNLDKGDFVFVLESKKAAISAEGLKPAFLEKTEELDLSNTIKELARQREKDLERWDDWQNKMNSDFQKIEDIDKSPVSSQEEKKAAWALFLRHYDENNPTSNEDETLRKKAKVRLNFWDVYNLFTREDDLKESRPVSKEYKEGEIVSISEYDVLPKLVKTSPPKFRRKLLAALVVHVPLRILITEKGDVDDVKIVGDFLLHKDVRAAVIKAVKKWKFTPAKKDGKKVKAWKRMTIRLEGK